MKYKLLIVDEKGNVRTIVENISEYKIQKEYGDDYLGLENIYEEGFEEISAQEILNDIKNTIRQMEKG